MRPVDYRREVTSEQHTTPFGYLATWRYTNISLWIYVTFCLIGPTARFGADVVSGDHPVRAGLIVAALAATVWFGARPLISLAKRGLGHDLLSWRQRAIHLVPGLVALAIAIIPPAAPLGVLYIPWLIISLIAFDLRSGLRWWWVVGAAGVLGGIYWAALRLDGAPLPDVSADGLYALGFIAVFTPCAIVFQVWLWELMRQVQDSGEAAAELAGVKERLRMAADLHDVQGHHLQVIALKAELAARQIDRDADTARGAMVEVQNLARQAIDETRDLVVGYRKTNLAEEIANAASVLEATGAEVAVDVPAGTNRPPVRHRAAGSNHQHPAAQQRTSRQHRGRRRPPHRQQ